MISFLTILVIFCDETKTQDSFPFFRFQRFLSFYVITLNY